MNKAVDEILKEYPFIMDEVRELQARLNEYIALQAETRDTLRAIPIDKQPGGTDPSDQTYGAVEKLIDTYQAEIDLCVAKINELLDRKKWLDKAYASLTEDERRIVCLRYNERWQTWKIMRRMGILDREKFYRLLNSAKDKVKKIMFT
jgi:hypothetical protein